MTDTRPRKGRPRLDGGVLVVHAGAEMYGSDRMALESAAALLDAGLEPTLRLPAEGRLAVEARRAGITVVVGGFPVVRKSALAPRGAVRFGAACAVAVPALLRELVRGRYSAVYVNTMTLPLWVWCARLLRLPVVVHVHEAETTAPRVLQAALAAPLRSASSIVFNSEYSRRAVVAVVNAVSDRSSVIYNGVAGPPTAPAPAAGGGALEVLYLGRLSERKGVLVAIDAVQQLVDRGLDVRLHLVGAAFVEHQDFAAEVDRRAVLDGLDGRVVLHGFSDDVWGHLAVCDVLVVPSVLPEPFGNTAVEGLLAGRPVLASDTGGLPEVLGDTSSSRLVPPGDASALADELGALARDLPARAAQALHDAAGAADRFAPAAYRRHITDIVSGVIR